MTDFILILIFSAIFGAAVRAHIDRRRARAMQHRAERFAWWWQTTGSGIAPNPGEDAEAHARRVAANAWDAGFAQRDAA
jgi:hypothetical protein